MNGFIRRRLPDRAGSHWPCDTPSRDATVRPRSAYKLVRMLGSLDNADNVRNGLTYVGCGSGALAVAIPFYTMANRAKSVQEVWTTQRGWKPSDTWWEGGLYRNAHETMVKAVAPSPTENDEK